ncbi:hypothetical protein Hanom_Chr11g00971641 [Helianthus anomalus]
MSGVIPPPPPPRPPLPPPPPPPRALAQIPPPALFKTRSNGFCVANQMYPTFFLTNPLFFVLFNFLNPFLT